MIFDTQAIEAAERAMDKHMGIEVGSFLWKLGLAAAEASLRERGMLRDGTDCVACWNEGSEAWVHQDATGPNFPVAIIRLPTQGDDTP